MYISMTGRAGIERERPGVVRGQAVQRMGIKSHSHRVFRLRLVTCVALLVGRLQRRVGSVHGVDKRWLRTVISVHGWTSWELIFFTLGCGRCDLLAFKVMSDRFLRAIQLYSLQFNYYYNTLFPFSINDLELIKSISSEKIQAAGCLIVMKTVKFGN